MNWSQNPRLKRFIEQQQFVHSLKEKFSGWGKLKVIPHFFIDLMDYLSSLHIWVLWSTISILGFAIAYWYLINNSNKPISFLDALYYSVIVFTTLGISDIPINNWVQVLVMLEVFAGYIFLGGLVTFLANWLGRKLNNMQRFSQSRKRCLMNHLSKRRMSKNSLLNI